MRKICLISTSRADYGIQSRLIRLLQDDEDVDFSLVVSGMHICKKYGLTYKEIEKDGIKITKMFDIGMNKESDDNIAEVMAEALVKFTEVLKEINPDIVVALGDRYEMFSAVQACVLCGIPIAHLHGGETTEGAIDEVFRHSMTKASYLHFTSCEEYRRRVIQLGESSDRVFNFGSLGVENTRKIDLLSKESLAKVLGINFLEKSILVTFHPVTFEKGEAQSQIDELIAALSKLENTTIIFTKPNADPENRIIAQKIDYFVAANKNAYAFSSIGVLRYLSLVNIVDVVAGNSSSGIIEVPSFKTPTINIGNRQKGRIQASSVINCHPQREEILKAFNKAYSPEFRGKMENVKNPYEGENTSQRILDVLKNANLEYALQKKFYDCQWEDVKNEY